MERQNVEPLKQIGVANQEEYTYVDREGEAQEGETLLSIKGIGRVLTYKDIYFASIPMFLISLFLGHVIFSTVGTGKNDLLYVLFANCILGLLLIYLTTKGNIIPTALFWAGIIFTKLAIWKDCQSRNGNDN